MQAQCAVFAASLAAWTCSTVCQLVSLCWVCGVLHLLAPVYGCACSVCCVCGVLGDLSPVHRCAGLVCCVARPVSLATWLLFTGMRAWCAVCAVCLAIWLLFTGVPSRCVVCRVRCPWPLGSCATLCIFSVRRCVCGVLGHLAPVHPCARSVVCVCNVLGQLAFVQGSVRLACWCLWRLGSCLCAAFCIVWCAFVNRLWFLLVPCVLACPTRFWCGMCSPRWSLVLGAWFCALVVAGRVPLWCASWPRFCAPCLVWSARSRCAGRLSRRYGAFPYQGLTPLDFLGGCAGLVEAG